MGLAKNIYHSQKEVHSEFIVEDVISKEYYLVPIFTTYFIKFLEKKNLVIVNEDYIKELESKCL